ncbi:FAD-binding oxidoreductase [Aetokthonos hydrillicola Thurmond2011]|jgi:bacterioferritin-associated ferredoxin|uniref:FAD-binding oxidoreductase n=1 Tax=Aetokthonos hydrillicola Thurmond2011 TaxID=2712845 RepID=A0AAP5I7C1_9CYAN|nr:FAD-binding oxidoreductase [Aetokthonos hydrillicola]MDR9896080.1 FAD-binding oxidoreductase [Aetokthonos hydrillicola Thurmond2011]
MPTDLSDVVSLTRSWIKIAQNKGIRRLAWVAPACPNGQVGDRLAEAESLIRGLNIETLILRHAPLFSHLLMHKKELRFRRTLSLPIGSIALPWLEPDAIAQGLSKWLHGEINNDPPEILTGSTQLSGADIVSELSAILRQSLSAQQFARLRFDVIDLDQSGQIDAQELLPYLLDLGYSQDECQSIEGIIEQTQVTMICGSCQPLVEEMLGSANLAIAELVNKEDLGRGMMRFQFRPVYEEVVASKPGQHILVQGRVDGSWVTRAYTLSSLADQTEQYEVTVKREELGLFSRWLCDRADSEALLRISQPRGEFVLEDENSVIFFAGGIGITPAIARFMVTGAGLFHHYRLQPYQSTP